MSKTTKEDLARKVSVKQDVTLSKARDIVSDVINSIVDILIEERGITFYNQFTLEVNQRAKRIGVNPHTGERIEFPAKYFLKARANKSLLEELNK